MLACMAFVINAKAYDFSEICGTGQLLYYTILSDTSVAVVESGNCDNYRLIGDLEIPSDRCVLHPSPVLGGLFGDASDVSRH